METRSFAAQGHPWCALIGRIQILPFAFLWLVSDTEELIRANHGGCQDKRASSAPLHAATGRSVGSWQLRVERQDLQGAATSTSAPFTTRRYFVIPTLGGVEKGSPGFRSA